MSILRGKHERANHLNPVPDSVHGLVLSNSLVECEIVTNKFNISEILDRIDEMKLNDSLKLYLACTILGVNYETDGSLENQVVIYTDLKETESGTIKRI